MLRDDDVLSKVPAVTLGFWLASLASRTSFGVGAMTKALAKQLAAICHPLSRRAGTPKGSIPVQSRAKGPFRCHACRLASAPSPSLRSCI
jgi:hypothetical protein